MYKVEKQGNFDLMKQTQTADCDFQSHVVCKPNWPYFDAVALTHGGSHGHGDGWDGAAEDLQQGEAQTLPVTPGGHTGEAGTAPESKAALSSINKSKAASKHRGTGKGHAHKATSCDSSSANHQMPLKDKVQEEKNLCWPNMLNVVV